ncbi:MAG TPA: carboxypeptidase-like regulatory domain-containing protein [Vicinamibacterales bacterium]|nr:carboxypeptidase-like regulatory domain-containing protein [Vicinamibacterales bacterium]
MRAPIVGLLLALLAGAGTETATQQLPVQDPGGRGGRAGGAPETRTGTGIVIGRVVEGVTNAGVPGAVVTIAGGGAPQQRVRVDPNGRFVLRDLPSGEFNIGASKPGYVGGSAGQRLPNGPSRPVELADGGRLGDLTLRLWKGGAIGGTVLDEGGEPVVGIKVMLAERRLVNGKRKLAGGQYSSAVTDDRGTYRFGTVAPGDYFVVARTSEEEIARGLMSLVAGDPGVIIPFATRAMGGRPEDLISLEAALRVYPPVFHPSALSPSEAAPVTVQSGEVRLGVDIRMKLVPIARLSGTLAGAPSGNQPQVRLVLSDPEGSEFVVATPIGMQGDKFDFLAVPAGKYVLRAYQSPRATPPPGAPPGLLPGGRGRGSTSPPPFPTEPAYSASVPITVNGLETASLTVTLRPGATISGRIEFDGAAAPPGSDQFGRLLISVLPEEPMTPGQSMRARVEPDGTFRTVSLPPGKYRLRLSPLASWTPMSAMSNGRDLFDEALDLDTADVTDVVVTFSDRPFASVSGTVRNAQGAPDPDALVAIFPVDPKLRTDLSPSARRLHLARTTKAGQYAIPGLLPGEYLIVAGGDELYENWLEASALQTLARRATRIEIAEGDARSQDLRSGSVR